MRSSGHNSRILRNARPGEPRGNGLIDSRWSQNWRPTSLWSKVCYPMTRMKKIILGICLLAAAVVTTRAEESMNAIQTALAATTISGYVDTSVEWTNGEVQSPPQVATNRLRKIPNWGTDILHYFIRDSFTNGGVISNATGYLDLRQQAQGRSARQQLSITLRKIGTNDTFTLLSAKVGETNYSEVTGFHADRWGNARLNFRQQSNGNGKAHPHDNLPELLNPVIDLASLAIADSATQLVMHADLLTVDRMQYHIKRKMDGYHGVGGLLHFNGTTNKTFFRLQALNLLPTNGYWLAFNGEVVSTNKTDRNGNLRIHTTLQPGVTPFTLKTVELLDSGTNLLLYTELP
jgi:hypothetical protein